MVYDGKTEEDDDDDVDEGRNPEAVLFLGLVGAGGVLPSAKWEDEYGRSHPKAVDTGGRGQSGLLVSFALYIPMIS